MIPSILQTFFRRAASATLGSKQTFAATCLNVYAKDADIAIHECFVAVPDLVAKMKFTPESALLVGTQVHTAPEAFGKIMSEVKPRIAVAYHFFNDFDTSTSVYERIRSVYDGPLSLADDFMVWNVTKDDITVRMAVTEERTWAPPAGLRAALRQCGGSSCAPFPKADIAKTKMIWRLHQLGRIRRHSAFGSCRSHKSD